MRVCFKVQAKLIERIADKGHPRTGQIASKGFSRISPAANDQLRHPGVCAVFRCVKMGAHCDFLLQYGPLSIFDPQSAQSRSGFLLVPLIF